MNRGFYGTSGLMLMLIAFIVVDGDAILSLVLILISIFCFNKAGIIDIKKELNTPD